VAWHLPRHGGQRYVFLKTLRAQGDEHWLERARRFAIHARGQVERWRTRQGSGRYSFWTGDLGAALFAADCLEARPAVPVVDGGSQRSPKSRSRHRHRPLGQRRAEDGGCLVGPWAHRCVDAHHAPARRQDVIAVAGSLLA
jgi:hypothetical protein